MLNVKTYTLHAKPINMHTCMHAYTHTHIYSYRVLIVKWTLCDFSVCAASKGVLGKVRTVNY